MIRSKLIAWVALGALVAPGVGRAGEPPAPPSSPPAVVVAGSTVTTPSGPLAVPAEGGLYLDPPQWRYQAELRRWYELELRVCKDQVENSPPGGWKPWAVGGGLGLVLGVVAGVLAVRAAK